MNKIITLFKTRRLLKLPAFPFSTPQSTPSPAILEVLKKYAQEMDESGVMEKLIPRQFTEQKLKQMLFNQRFSQ